MSSTPLEGEKIISAKEAARIEKVAIDRGAKEMQFMEGAGASIAEATQRYMNAWGSLKHVHLVIGKGNNGGDAYAAGIHLLEHNCIVIAWELYPTQQCSPLSQIMRARFVKKGGKTSTTIPPLKEGVIVDGIYGTGFSGKLEPKVAEAIRCMNEAKLPIIAIDLPSGVHGNTGETGDVAVRARVTMALEFPKTGSFLRKGWDCSGEICTVPYGLSTKEREAAREDAYIFAAHRIPDLLPQVLRSRHKYETGYVLGIAGSRTMPGAALLASFATLKAGAGIVRLFSSKEGIAACTTAPHEVIREPFHVSRFKQEVQRAKSLFLGPGLGVSSATQKLVQQVFAILPIPAVVDADALRYLPPRSLPENIILTPQHAEMERLSPIKEQILEQSQAYVERRKCTLVLKGGPTWIFHPHTSPLLIAQGHPALAKAGTGDVLTGVIAALLAQGLPTRTAAALGASFHGLAGECAAKELSSYGVVASDLFTYLPRVMRVYETSCATKASSFLDF